MPDDEEYIIAHCDQCRHNQATRTILFGRSIKTTKCKFCGKKIPVNKENAKIYGDMEVARVVQELNMKEFQDNGSENKIGGTKMKFRKKPVVIEAEQWFPGKHVDGVCGDDPNKLCGSVLVGGLEDNAHLKPHVHTLEGIYAVTPGDWIITGVKGEKYPCKPDIFPLTYEPVEEDKKGIWKGCGHPVKAIILDNNMISIACYMEFEENNPKELCLDCWEKENKI